MIRRITVPILLASLTAACEQQTALEFTGTTEWDRNVVLAEASERVLEWLVAEGDPVASGEVILRLDGSRLDARISASEARLAEARSLLVEREAGPRQETIVRARAELASAQAAAVEGELEFARAAELLRRELTSQSMADQARATRDERQATVAARQAALGELVAGTRIEQIDQARARVAAMKAELEELNLTRSRLDVKAPRQGRVDALPFKPGDQPRQGDVLVSLLVGEMPFARIFIPASERTRFSEGDTFSVAVEGIEEPFPTSLRSIRSEASFTPYYALTGDDASRLVYRAELLFDGATAAALPAGLPLVATPLPAGIAGDDLGHQ